MAVKGGFVFWGGAVSPEVKTHTEKKNHLKRGKSHVKQQIKG